MCELESGDYVYHDGAIECYHDPASIDPCCDADLEKRSVEYVDAHDIKPCSVCYPQSSQTYFLEKQQDLLDKFAGIPSYSSPKVSQPSGDVRSDIAMIQKW